MKQRYLGVLVLLMSSVAVASGKSQLEQARTAYNKGQYQKAVNAYTKIAKDSDYYVDAVEEKAQALGQMGRYADALAELKSAMAPQFEGLVSAETYLTAIITQLKTCDYAGVLETTKKFKEAFKTRLTNLQSVASTNSSHLRQQAYAAAHKGNAVTVLTLGTLVRQLPRNTVKDKLLSILVKDKETFELQLQRLARAEIKDIERVINRMQVAEVEVEHRLNVLQATGGRDRQGGYQKSSAVLVFPADEEVWIDEIGHYQARVETCPDLSRRAGL